MPQSTRTVHVKQLITGIVIAAILTFSEYLLNQNHWAITGAFFILSLYIGSRIEAYFKNKLFRIAISSFISTLKDIRVKYKLNSATIQEVMKEVSINLVASMNVNIEKSDASEFHLAGKQVCRTCTTGHLTDEYGRCTTCKIGASFWTAMNERNQHESIPEKTL